MVTSEHVSLIGLAELKLAAPEMARSGQPFSISAEIFFGVGTLETLKYSFEFEAKQALLSLYFTGIETIPGSKLNASNTSSGKIQGTKGSNNDSSNSTRLTGGVSANATGIIPTIGVEYDERVAASESMKLKAIAEKVIEPLTPLPQDEWRIEDPFSHVNGAGLNGPYSNSTLCEAQEKPNANHMHVFGEVSVSWDQFSLTAEGYWMTKGFRERFQKEKMVKAILAHSIASNLQGEVQTSKLTGAIVVARSEVRED